MTDKLHGGEKGEKEKQDKKDAKKEPSSAQKKQQERMRDCNEQAGAKKMEGDARKKFMSACLKRAMARSC